MCIFLKKLDQVNASYARKCNLILSVLQVCPSNSSIQRIIMHFLEKYVKKELKNAKFSFLLIYIHPIWMKLAEVISLNVIQLCETFKYFTVNHHFATQSCIFSKNSLESKLKIIKLSFLWVYFQKNWMKITKVMFVNAIQTTENFKYFIVIHQFTT